MKPVKSTPFRTSISHSATMAVVFALFTAPFSLAATLYWDGGSVDIAGNGNGASAGGSGTWNNTIKNWDAGAVPYVAWPNGTDTAEINGGTQTLTLGDDITVGRINQKAGASGATIAEGAGLNSITLGATTTIFNVAASVTAGRTLNVNAEVTGNKNLSIQGPTTTAGGAVNLNRVNTFTGTLSIDDTNLRIGNGGTAGQLNSGNYSSAISITSTGTFAYSSSLDQILGGVISGAGSLTKNTAGSTLTLTNANTYSGATTINGGKLAGVVGGHHQNSDVTLTNVAATYGVSITDNTKSWTCKSLATTAAGTLEFNFGAETPSGSASPLVVTNLADFSTTPLVSVVVSAGLSPGIYPLMTWGSTSGTIPTTAELTVSTVTPGTIPSLSVSGNTLNLVIDFPTTDIVKDDNALPLNNGLSWVGGLVPATSNIAKWNNTVQSANTTDLGADLTWAGISIENPTGPVTINGTNTLTLGAASVDIDMSTATSDLTVNSPLALGADNIWDVAASRTLTVGGQVSGAFGFTKLGAGTAVLSGANTYTGNTNVTGGVLRLLGASERIPDGAGNGNVSLAGTLDLNGRSETVNGLSGSGIVDNTATGTESTLTAGANNQTSTFGGILQNTGSAATLNLTKTGTGTLTLSGANTLGGVVTIGNGALVVNNTAPLDNATGIAMGDGTTLRSNVDGAVINAPITLGAVGTTSTIHASTFDGSGTTLVPFTLGGAISGDGNLILSGVEATNSYGSINLNAASGYAGSTLITTVSGFAGGPPINANLFVRLGVENALPVTTVLTMDGGDGAGSGGRTCELNLNGNNQTLAGLTNVMTVTARNQTVTNTGAPATLTVNNSADYTFGRASVHVFNSTNYTTRARIQGAISLVKSGVGKFTLLESHTYTGSTTITGGTLALGSSTALPAASAVTIGAGTLGVGAAVSAATTGTLNCTGAAVINLADGTSAIAFGDSSALTWTGTLNITGAFVSGASIKFGDGSGAGLSAGQLATQITAAGFANFGINGSGFLTADSVGGSGFDTWKTTNNAVGQTLADDHDGDGVDNGTEYFIGGPNGNTTGFTALPGVANDSGTLSVTFTKAADYAGVYGVDYVVETSDTLADPWAPETEGVNVIITGTNVKYTFPAPLGTKKFARLKVNGP